MYLRTTRRKARNGTEVAYYSLARSFRDPLTKSVRTEVIHNFGRVGEAEKAELAALCQGISQAEKAVSAAGGSIRSGFEDFLPADVVFIRPRFLGPSWVIAEMWERVGFGPALSKLGRGSRVIPPYERVLFALTVNRLCDPESKLGLWDRWLDTIYLPGCHGLKLAQLYQALDFLGGKVPTLERWIGGVFHEKAHVVVPMLHRNQGRVEAHEAVCAIAQHLQGAMEQASSRPWLDLRQALSSIQALEFHRPPYWFHVVTGQDDETYGIMSTLSTPIPQVVLGIERQNPDL